MKPYRHKVQYYETDKMGITHHSNYIRWMEEARIDFLEQLGWSYASMEAKGIFSPVLSVSCDYKHSSTFSEIICINVTVEKLTGARLTLGYQMENEEGKTVCLAHSEHCFLNVAGRIVRLSREQPEFYAALESQVSQGEM